MNYDDMLMIKAAWYYYLEEMTQQEISNQLGISRMRVIKLLEKARQTGAIQFRIREDSTQRMEVEQKLREKYGLKDVFVIPSVPEDTSERHGNENIAKAAAAYINDRVTDNFVINMGYGDTPSRVISHLSVMSDRTISCVSLTGGVNYYLPYTKFNMEHAKLYLMPTPLLVSTKEMADALYLEHSVREIHRMIPLAAMTVVGIGAMDDDATIITSGILSKNDFTYLKMQGAVGDLLSHFIDKDGNPVGSPVDERFMSTDLSLLKEMDNVIGVASGSNKVHAIQAALNGAYLDVLITDENTANQLIELINTEGG